MGDLKEQGKVLINKAFAGKIGHRIAIIGNEIFSGVNASDLQFENGSVEFFTVNDRSKINRLTSYTLCIVAYEAFSNESSYQSVFIKQMNEALEQGVSFCFVYYTEDALGLSDNNSKFSQLRLRQIATQVLSDYNIGKPYRNSQIIHEGKINRNELANYLKKWGSTIIRFRDLSENVEVLYESQDEDVLGFSVSASSGKLIYLPFIRGVPNKDDIKNGLKCLIDSLLTYIAKSQIDLPVFAKDNPFFSDEEQLLEQRNSLQEKLIILEKDLQKFDEAKSLLFHNEYHLEKTLPKFLENHLGFKIEQNETYKEDFWLIDDSNKKLAIAEIKTKPLCIENAEILKKERE